MYYNFILSMWVMGRCTEDFVRGQQEKGRITEIEMNVILATPQIQQ
ncbi:hypothetical protein [Cellulosilyticum lentocellum]|uniref:Uncharacterized protein n=1 Tax=Cellulosilyticum lentocellum (strain ATCC 49066 / DSM 5427 / NCIMB 11756 / RHM5) TaxID=642492 RepID=F2JRA9_CELLD|nr:hypothetical protein [Cellulosilyticum lentocellum]ADZ82718.1 hypothetical protein Clole_0986 [Cellulosilyticum lentocellum DSM 5427]